MALGISVASATVTCTNPTNGAPSICIGNSTTQNTNLNITWSGSGNIYQMGNDTYNTGDFSFWLEDASANKSITIENDPDYPDGYKAKIFGENKLVFTNNGKTIKMGDGTKTLGTGGGAGTTVTIDFGTVTDSNAYALQGNLFLGEWSSGVVNATFGGKGIQGIVTLKGGNNTLAFNSGAGITGTLKGTGGTSKLLFDSSTTSGVNLSTSITKMVFVGGTTTFGFKDNTSGNNKIFSINTSSIGTNAETGTENLIFAGGKLSFEGAKKVYFDTSTANQGDGTLTVASGAVEFVIDPTLIRANQTSDAFAKGNLTLNGGSAIFRLKDTSGVTGSNPFTDPNAVAPTDTYYVDGNITITGGGLSAFWDDEKGFYGKIDVTGSGHTFSQSGGLIGKNDVWFQTAISDLPSIQATTGTSHIVFDNKQTISGTTINVDGSDKTIAILARGGASQILFVNGATITGDIFATNGSSNNITFKQETVINGNITSIYNSSKNIITAEKNLTVNKILTTQRQTVGYGDNSTNTINFNGAILTVKQGIVANGDYDSSHQNIINLTQAGAQLVVSDGGITARNDDGIGATRTKVNKITFSNGGTLSLDGRDTTTTGSFNFDGIYADNGNKNSIIFEETKNDAIIEIKSGKILASAGTNEIIGVKSFGTSPVSIIAYGYGTNTITASHNLTIDSLQIGQGGEFSEDGAKNTVNFSGDTLTINSGIATAGYFGSSAVNEINLKSANASLIVSDKGITARQMNGFATLGFIQRNNITFEKGGELTLNGSGTTSNDAGFDFGGILARNGEQNTITFNSNNNAIINVTNSQILARDSGSNTITFNGSGTNTINSGITANGGTNTINFNNGGVGSISGDVIAQGGGTNTITASNNLEIGSLQIGQGGTNSADWAKNTVNFSGTTLTINNGIATAGYFGSSAVNEINLKSANASLIVSDKGITTRQLNELADRNYTQRNNITFEKGGELTLNGSGTTSDDAGFDFGGILARDGEQNTITFNSNNNAIINVTNSQILASNGGINNIAFNGTGTNTINSGITANGGTNTITATNSLVVSGSVSATGSGINSITATSGNATFAGISTKDYNASSSGNTINFGSGSITINTRSGDSDSDINGKALYAKNGSNNNTITARTILINGEIFANSQATNSLTASSSITVTGNIGGGATNNFTLTADNASLTLSGATNNISTFTAFQTATNGNTLVLDGSNNSVNTTIATLANGEKLSVNFSEGNSAKTLAITASNKATTTQIDLKSVVLSGISESNTLDLSTATQATIANQVNVADNQDLTIKIGGNLILTGGLTTAGTSEINVIGDTNTATSTLSGGNITASKLNITSASTSSTLTFNSAITDFATFATNSATNAITLGTTAQTVTFGTTQNTTATPTNPVVFGSVTFSGTNNQTLAINGGTNTINTLALGSNANTLAIGGGKATITDSVTIGAGKDFTLKLSSSSDKANLSSTDVVVNHALVANGGSAKVLFTGGTDNQRYLSTLTLNSTGNSLTSVTSQAKNAKILMNGASDANLGTLSIAQNASLLIGFEGTDNASVTLGNGSSNVVIGDMQTFGISIGGSGTKNVSVTANGGRDIVFAKGSTLIVDFQKTTSTDNITATLGDGTGFRIEGGSNSIINLRGGEGKSTLTGGVTVAGGNNTVNFLDDATFGNVTLSSGSNTINVYDGTVGDSVVGTVTINDIDSVTNTINLGDYATLKLETSGQGELISSGLNNELNFKGNNAKLQGGFGATSATQGSATINVGSADKELVKGIITGEVRNATLAFNSGTSILELQNTDNSFKSIDSQAQYGILALNANGKAVNATITGKTSIDAGKSLIFSFDGDNDSRVTTNGNLTVAGTLGVIINSTGGNKVITGNIDLGGRGTLLVEFAGTGGTATLGDGDGITIGGGESSIINFRAKGAKLKNTITLDGGTSTINFYTDGEVGGIDLKSGTNTITVADKELDPSDPASTGNIVKLTNVGTIGTVTNTIKLGKNAQFKVGSAGDQNLTTSLSNTLNFTGADATFQGGFGASGNGVASINVDATGASINGNVTKSSLAFGSNNGALTLKGATNTLTTISTVDGASNTLALDTSNGNNTTTVLGALDASGLSINLAGTDADANKATLNLNGGSLGEINVASSANALALNGGETSINTFVLASNAVLNIEFNGGGLSAVNGIAKDADKTFNLSVNGGNSFVSGGNIDANTLSFENNASLAIRSAEASFATVSGNGTLVLDGANGATIAGKPSVKVTLTDVTGNLTAKFNGSEAKGTELVMSKAGQTLNTIAFGANSTNNKLTLATGTTTITNGVSVGNGNAITFSLADGTTLNLAGGMTSAGNSTISSAGDASVTLVGGGVDDKNDQKAINLTNLDLQGGTTAQLTIKNAKADISNFNAKTLVLDGSTGAVDTTLHIFNNGLDVEMKGDAVGIATLTLNGGSIASVSATSGDASKNIINFKSGTTTIDTISGIDAGMALNLKGGNLILSQGITADGSTVTRANHISVDVSIDGGSTLSLARENNAIHSLSGNGVVDLAVADFNGNPLTRSVKVRSGFKTLAIANYSGNNTFNVYVNTKNPSNGKKADQIEVTSGTGNATFTVMGNIDDILGITYSETDPNKTNVLIASGTTGVNVEGGRSLIGYDIIKAQVIQTADGSVYLGEAISEGVAQEIKDVASSALTVNYDLFLANFNSLNKRMGELRDNPYSQGVWTRVFGGAMSNDFGAGSKTQYVTAQAGYDYSLTLGDAKNYMGIAVAYGHSTTKSNTLNIQASQGATIALQDVKSNMVEVGIYNSYVMDSGWYNDTIFKFDYIMSSFTMTDNLSLESETNNFAMVLSDEFGYRYKFAENEKGNWYIDPQVEVAFGYFNQSDFNRAMLATNSTLEATQDNILTLRTRAGLSLGKKFNTAKGFASLYVGAFYEYDYINGGDAEVLSKSGIANPLDKLESNGRAIVNVGSNIELTEGVRMYIDVEKSFGDKQRTDMQFNFGARYSFGEKTPTISYQEAQKKRVAPLKVEDKQESAQESKTEAQANTEAKQ